jgi:hypothetical protein
LLPSPYSNLFGASNVAPENPNHQHFKPIPRIEEAIIALSQISGGNICRQSYYLYYNSFLQVCSCTIITYTENQYPGENKEGALIGNYSSLKSRALVSYVWSIMLRYFNKLSRYRYLENGPIDANFIGVSYIVS